MVNPSSLNVCFLSRSTTISFIVSAQRQLFWPQNLHKTMTQCGNNRLPVTGLESIRGRGNKSTNAHVKVIFEAPWKTKGSGKRVGGVNKLTDVRFFPTKKVEA